MDAVAKGKSHKENVEVESEAVIPDLRKPNACKPHMLDTCVKQGQCNAQCTVQTDRMQPMVRLDTHIGNSAVILASSVSHLPT